MLVIWTPQRSDSELSYTFDGDIITANLDGETDVFDFSMMPDGEVDTITSTLDPCPVLGASRINGQLKVTLLRFHGQRASYEERFPEPEVIS